MTNTDIYNQIDHPFELSKPDKGGWWIHEKYNQYKMYYVSEEALDSKACNCGGRWYLWRDMTVSNRKIT